MASSWIPLGLGLVLIASGIILFRNRARASRSITEVQGAVFPFLKPLLAKKKKPTGLAVVGVGWIAFGAVMVVVSAVSIAHRTWG
jgi:hypothetical protein